MIVRNEWESHFFGREIGQFYSVNLPNSPLSADLFQPFELVQAKVSANNEPLLTYLYHHQFYFVEGEMVLEWGIPSHIFQCDEDLIVPLNYATLQDLPQLEPLFSNAFPHSRFRPPYFSQEENQRFYREWIGNAVRGTFDQLCLVKRTTGGQILGGISLRIEGKIVKIGLLAVAESERRQGIGRQLLQDAIQWAMKQGANRLQVATQLSNFSAMHFYQRYGATIRTIFYWLYRNEDTF